MKWSMKLFHKNQTLQHPFEQLFMHDLSIVETRFDCDLTKLEPVGKWITFDILFLDTMKNRGMAAWRHWNNSVMKLAQPIIPLLSLLYKYWKRSIYNGSPNVQYATFFYFDRVQEEMLLQIVEEQFAASTALQTQVPGRPLLACFHRCSGYFLISTWSFGRCSRRARSFCYYHLRR